MMLKNLTDMKRGCVSHVENQDTLITCSPTDIATMCPIVSPTYILYNDTSLQESLSPKKDKIYVTPN